MRRVALLVVALVVMLWPTAAEACSCGDPPPPLTALKYADTVFVGTVSAIERHGYTNGVQVRVNRAFKGTSTGSSVFFTTGAGGGDCGLQVSEGAKWLFYLERAGGELRSISCGRSRPVGGATDEIAELSAGLKPKPAASADPDASAPIDASIDAAPTASAAPSAAPSSAPSAAPSSAPAPAPAAKGCAAAGSSPSGLAALGVVLVLRLLRKKREERGDDR